MKKKIIIKKLNYKEIVETLEVISDPETMREIAEGIEAYNSGKGKSLSQLKKELEV